MTEWWEFIAFIVFKMRSGFLPPTNIYTVVDFPGAEEYHIPGSQKKKGSHQLLEYSITWAHYAERVSYDSVLEKFTVHLNRHLYQQMKTWCSFRYHEAFHRLLWDHRVRGKDPACRNTWRLHRRDTVCSKTSTCAHLITAVFLSC